MEEDHSEIEGDEEDDFRRLETFAFKYDDDRIDDDLFDHYQNIARASFDDMVHDDERNQLYYSAIEKSIKRLRAKGEKHISVLDIGSGTGLLSMMAIQAGADSVTACECFEPIAKCSKKIIDQNGMSDRIKVVNVASQSLTIKEDQKPNLVVAELLDSELIGEGCLFAYRDALTRLSLGPETLFVPLRAHVYVQLVQSEKLFHYHQFRKSFRISSRIEIRTPPSFQNCFGSHLLHDIQMNRLKPDEDFEILSDPVKVFEFHFNNKEHLKLNEHNRLKVNIKRKFDKPMMLFFWWDIDLEDEGINLSCAPYWARSEQNSSSKTIAWREHWMQTIYYLPAFAFDENNQIDGFIHDKINEKKTVLIDAFHDPFSFWFDFPNQINPTTIDSENLSDYECWSCICGFHSHLSRSRLYWLNNVERYTRFWNLINVYLQGKNCIRLAYFGDESILPLVCSFDSRIDQIFIVVGDQKSFEFFKRFRQHNQLLRKIIICSVRKFKKYKDRPAMIIDGFITDFHFRDNSVLFPQLHFFNWTQNNPNKSLFFDRFSFPQKIVLKCLLVRFEHLWKCFAPIGTLNIAGKDLNFSAYDDLIMTARKYVDWQIEPRFLWEYRSWPLIFKPIDLFKFDLLKNFYENDFSKYFEIDLKHLNGKTFNEESIAIVFWFDGIAYENLKNSIIEGGLVRNQILSFDNEIEWVREQQQAISFLTKNQWKKIKEDNILKIQLKFDIPKKRLMYEIV